MSPSKILPILSLLVRAEYWGDSANAVPALISRSQNTDALFTPFQLPIQSTELQGQLWGKLTPFQSGPKHFSSDWKQKNYYKRFSKYQITWSLCCDGLYRCLWLLIYFFSEKNWAQRVPVLVFLISVRGNNCYTYRARLFLWIKHTLKTEKRETENRMLTVFSKSVQAMYDEELRHKFSFKIVLNLNF